MTTSPQVSPCNYADLLGAVFGRDPDGIIELWGLDPELRKRRPRKPCSVCGARSVEGYGNGPNVFCSVKCHDLHLWIPLVCNYCGSLFYRKRASVLAAATRRDVKFQFCNNICNGHWFAATHGFAAHPENTKLGGRRPQTHCKRGHPFDTQNTYVGKVQRRCRACVLMRLVKKRKEANK